MATEYPYIDTRLGSQLYLFPRQALRGSWGSSDLETVLTGKFFGEQAEVVTGTVSTTQAAQGVAASGTATAAATPSYGSPFKWTWTRDESPLWMKPQPLPIYGEVVTVQQPQRVEMVCNTNTFERDLRELLFIIELAEAA